MYKIFPGIALVCLLALGSVTPVSASVSISFTAGVIRGADGLPVDLNSIGVLVADTGHNGFGTAATLPGSTLLQGGTLGGSDNLILKTFSAEDLGDGIIGFNGVVNYTNVSLVTPGTPLALFWFSTITSPGATISRRSSVSYGFYTTDKVDYNSGSEIAYIAPPDGYNSALATFDGTVAPGSLASSANLTASNFTSPFNYANAQLSGTAVNFGNIHAGKVGAGAQTIGVTNAVITSVNYQDSLVVGAISANANVSATGFGTVGSDELAAGAAARNVSFGVVNTNTLGSLAGNVTLNLNSTSTVSGLDAITTTATIQTDGLVYSGLGVWNSTNTDGNWNDFSKWQGNGGAPGLDSDFVSTDTATFGNTLGTGSTTTVTVNGFTPSVKSISFSNANGGGFTINATYGGAITLNNGTNAATLNVDSGVHTINSSVNLFSDLAVAVAASSSLTVGQINGSGKALTKTGDGILTLVGINTYTGATDVTAGTLSESGTGTIASTSSLTVNGATAIFDLGANHNDTITGTVSVQGGSITGTGTSKLTSTNTFDMQSGSVSAILSGSVGLSKTTSGTVTLSGVNAYSGPTNVGAGTLQAGATAGGHAFGANSAVSIANEATAKLALNGFNQGIGSLAGFGQVYLGTNTLTVGGLDTSTTYAGVISGTNSSGLTKIGSGTLELAHANTFSGLTTVSAGTVNAAVAGALSSSSIRVEQGASLLLSASGAANGDNLNLAGGTLNTAGLNQSLGALSLTANVSARSIIDFTSLHVADTLTFSSGSRTSGASLLVENWDLAGGTTHLVFTSNANLDAAFLSSVQFQGFQPGAVLVSLSGRGYEVQPNQLTPVPEPSTIIGALALLGFVGWRERRRISSLLKG